MHVNDRTLKARDGTTIAWGMAGEGPPLVFVNGYTTSHFFWRYILERFVPQATCITWDYPGHGRSEPARSDDGCTVPALMDDLRRVMDAAGVERAPLLGFSMGCQMVLEAWRHIPDRISAILPILGPYEHMLDTVFGWPFNVSLQRIMRTGRDPGLGAGMALVIQLMHRSFAYRLGQLMTIVGPDAPREDVSVYMNHFEVLDTRTMRLIGLNAQAHSARDLLPTITVPVLIVAGLKDVFSPGHLGEEAHSQIPTSELLVLPHGTHTSLWEHPDEIGGAAESFLRRHGLL